ncbi:MAG: hypothetical protein DRI65_18885 [Chloroflexota bacterium]|nr:MAG: hypothetical protein DRI65_18885 [Chloroflexota bacterium]
MKSTLRNDILKTILLAVCIAVIFPVGIDAQTQHEEKPPPGVEMLLPRGGIPAVFEPVFVQAVEADISDDAWILGVIIDGEAHAYSLNLLNAHEIVNDRFGDVPVAAVW